MLHRTAFCEFNSREDEREDEVVMKPRIELSCKMYSDFDCELRDEIEIIYSALQEDSGK